MTAITRYPRVKERADRAEPDGVGPDLTSLPRTTTCPSCGGALRPEATWCSLCYYDFRAAAAPAAPPVAPVPSAVQQPVSQAPVVPAPAVPVDSPSAPPAQAAWPSTPEYGGVDPLTGPLLDLALPPVPVAQPVQAPVVEAPVPAAAPVETPKAVPSWPCLRCGEDNPLESMQCLTCGSAFLAHAREKPSLEIPYVGDLYAMSRARRAGVAGVAVLAVLLPLMLLVLLTSGGGAKTGGTSTGDQTTVPTVTSQQ